MGIGRTNDDRSKVGRLAEEGGVGIDGGGASHAHVHAALTGGHHATRLSWRLLWGVVLLLLVHTGVHHEAVWGGVALWVAVRHLRSWCSVLWSRARRSRRVGISWRGDSVGVRSVLRHVVGTAQWRLERIRLRLAGG